MAKVDLDFGRPDVDASLDLIERELGIDPAEKEKIQKAQTALQGGELRLRPEEGAQLQEQRQEKRVAKDTASFANFLKNIETENRTKKPTDFRLYVSEDDAQKAFDMVNKPGKSEQQILEELVNEINRVQRRYEIVEGERDQALNLAAGGEGLKIKKAEDFDVVRRLMERVNPPVREREQDVTSQTPSVNLDLGGVAQPVNAQPLSAVSTQRPVRPVDELIRRATPRGL